jgi:hypothetical protein
MDGKSDSGMKAANWCDYDCMADTAEPSAPLRTDTRSSGGHHGLRWTGAVVLLLIAALLVPVTLVARYARSELLNTDRFVATVAPLADSADVQTALANRITTTIMDSVDLSGPVNQIADKLNVPALAVLITGPVRDWVSNFIHSHVLQFLQTEQFRTLWAVLTRGVHQSVDRLLTGEKGGVLSTSGDAVNLNIGPLVDVAKQQLVSDGFNLASKVPSVNVAFTLFQSDQLPKIQRYVRLLNTLATWLPWITLVLFVLAIFLAPSRRRAALIGVAASAILLAVILIANPLLRRAYGQQLSDRGLNQPAGLTVYDAVVHYLIAAATTTLVASLILLIWLWLAGRSRPAREVHRLVDRAGGASARGLGWHRNGLVGVLDTYRGWIFAVLGLAGLVVLLHNPYVVTVVWMTVVALLIAGAFAILHRLPAAPAAAAPAAPAV